MTSVLITPGVLLPEAVHWPSLFVILGRPSAAFTPKRGFAERVVP